MRTKWALLLMIVCASAWAQTFSAHLRVAPKRGAMAGWADARGHKVCVEFTEVLPDNNWTPIELNLSYGDAKRKIVWPAGVNLDAVSLMINADTDSVYLQLANRRDRLPVSLPPVLDLSAPPVAFTHRCKVLRDDATYLPAEKEVETAGFESLKALSDYISQSTDPAEGVWQYYDSDTRPLKATIGGKYVLATIKDPDCDGGLLIIMLDGYVQDESWHEMDIKGRMKPSAVEGVYDLEWLTADRILLRQHSWATIGDDGLLTLAFPHWQAKMRFAPALRHTP